MNIRVCNLPKQYNKYKDKIDAAIARVLKSGIYILGTEVVSFEEEFASYIGTKYAVGVANGTDALLLSMMCFDIGPGDEVITTPFTAIPTVSAIIDTGAKPVFVDIDINTYLMDLDKVKKAITKRTKAIIPVHIFGNVVDVPKLRKIIGPEIKIIEDACQAHGSSLRGKKAGSMGDLAAFSFYPTKNLGGVGDGGIITTNDSRLAEKIRLLRMYGMTDRDHIVISGINSRLDELQAAVLRVKLKYLDSMNEKRSKLVSNYIKKINSNLFEYQKIVAEVYSNNHVFVPRLIRGDRKQFFEYLKEKGIQSIIYYMVAIHLQEANKFLGYKNGDFPVTEKLCREAIALPLYPEMTQEEFNYIVSVINYF